MRGRSVDPPAAARVFVAAVGPARAFHGGPLGPPERLPWGGVPLHPRSPSGNAVTLLQPPGGA